MMLKVKIRRQMMKGIAVMVIFCFFAVAANIIVEKMDPVSFSRYQSVDIKNLALNPSKYDGKDITFAGDIIAVSYNESLEQHVIELERGILAFYQDAGNLCPRIHVTIRGRCTVIGSSVTVEVYELHLWNVLPYLLTIPGVIVFVVTFFYVFSIDWKNLVFIQRRKNDA